MKKFSQLVILGEAQRSRRTSLNIDREFLRLRSASLAALRMASIVVVLCASAHAAELSIPSAACKLLTTHQPVPDVAYQPSVDTRGNAVVPADISPPVQLGGTITIPLTVDLAQQFNIPMGKTTGSEATVALVTIENGHVYLNGQPLSDEGQDNLRVLCLNNTK